VSVSHRKKGAVNVVGSPRRRGENRLFSFMAQIRARVTFLCAVKTEKKLSYPGIVCCTGRYDTFFMASFQQ